MAASTARLQEIKQPYTRSNRSTKSLLSQLTKERANPPVQKLVQLMKLDKPELRSKSVCLAKAEKRVIETPRSITTQMLSRNETLKTYDSLVAKVN